MVGRNFLNPVVMKPFYFVVLVLLFSCQKDYRRPQQPASKDDPENLSEQLIGTWKLYEQSSIPANDWNGDGKLETDMYGSFSACEKDAGLTLLANGKGLIRLSCSDTRAINWKIANNSDDFNYQLETNGVFSDYRNNSLIQLNQNIFIFSGTIQAANGKTYMINYRYFRR